MSVGPNERRPDLSNLLGAYTSATFGNGVLEIGFGEHMYLLTPDPGRGSISINAGLVTLPTRLVSEYASGEYLESTTRALAFVLDAIERIEVHLPGTRHT